MFDCIHVNGLLSSGHQLLVAFPSNAIPVVPPGCNAAILLLLSRQPQQNAWRSMAGNEMPAVFHALLLTTPREENIQGGVGCD